jgi:GxxExxY protein
MSFYRHPLAYKVIGCAIEVHREMGPGLLESAYSECASYIFTINKIPFQRQVSVPVLFKGHKLDCGYRADFLIAGDLLIELKTVERILPIHTAQILTYLKLLKARQGLLINFHTLRLIDGLRSYVWTGDSYEREAVGSAEIDHVSSETDGPSS